MADKMARQATSWMLTKVERKWRATVRCHRKLTIITSSRPCLTSERSTTWHHYSPSSLPMATGCKSRTSTRKTRMLLRTTRVKTWHTPNTWWHMSTCKIKMGITMMMKMAMVRQVMISYAMEALMSNLITLVNVSWWLKVPTTVVTSTSSMEVCKPRPAFCINSRKQTYLEAFTSWLVSEKISTGPKFRKIQPHMTVVEGSMRLSTVGLYARVTVRMAIRLQWIWQSQSRTTTRFHPRQPKPHWRRNRLTRPDPESKIPMLPAWGYLKCLPLTSHSQLYRQSVVYNLTKAHLNYRWPSQLSRVGAQSQWAVALQGSSP